MNKQLKILSLTRGSVLANTGTPLRIRNLIYQLSKKENIILYTCSANDTLPFIQKRLEHFKIEKKIVFIELFKLIRLIKKNKIKVVIGHTMTSWFYLAAIKFTTRAKIVLEMHGFIEEEALEYGRIGKIKYYINKHKYQLFYGYCDLITTCSNMATAILKKFNKNVITIFGGVDTNIFYPIHVSRDNHKNKIIIGYAGNPRIWQGIDFLFNAFKQLRENDPIFVLYALLSEKFAIQSIKGVKFFKRVEYEKAPEFLAKCDILVIPRPDTKINRISFPSKLPEYMSMGKAIVASKTSDMHEIITDKYDGLLFEPNNVAEFINCILSLRDSGKRNQLGNNARQTALAKLTWEKQASLFSDCLLRLF